MLKLRCLGLASLTTVAATLTMIPPAAADAGMDCTFPNEWNPDTGTCTIKVTNPGGNTGNIPGPGGPGGGTGSGQCTKSDGRVIPCSFKDGVWNGSCYMFPTKPQPPKSDAVWRNNTTGGIWECYTEENELGMLPRPHWRPEDPNGVRQPSPREIAEQALAKMTFNAPKIGMGRPSPGGFGVIGIGVWFWVDNAGETTFGPMVRSASAGTVTVTATATVDRVVWTTGDGKQTVCLNAGHRYTAGQQNPSPSCGHVYEKTGKYSVTAQAFWTIRWEGGGESGVFNRDLTSSPESLTMGEVQVINK